VKVHWNISAPAALVAVVTLGVQFVAADAFGKRKPVQNTQPANSTSIASTTGKSNSGKKKGDSL
jgi:hypothetical protein